jgi:ABC-type transport system substrate-binding protein
VKKYPLVFIAMVGLLLICLVVVSCGKETTTPPPGAAPTTQAPAATSAPAAATSAPAASKPAVTAAPTTDAAAQKYGGAMKVILRADVTVLGTPSEGPGGSPHRSVEAAYDVLVRYDENFTIQPRLADSWDIAPDGKSITFHLKKGIKFSDGTPFNADAVKYNLEVYAPSGVKTPSQTKIVSMDVIDDNTLRLNLKAYDSTIFLDLGDSLGLMCSPTAAKKATTAENMAIDHLVGTGPFKLAEFKRSQYAKYVKNPLYWQPGKPYIDTWEVDFITDSVTSLMALQKGDAWVMHGLKPTEANQIKGGGVFDIISTQVKLMNVLLPDGKNQDSPWSNPKVRMAAEYAIDKDALAKGIGEGFYDASYQFAPAGAAHFAQDAPKRSFDPAKAKALLTEAGFANGFSTKIYASQTYNKDILVGIQTYLKNVGINAELDLADSTRMVDMQNNGWRNGLYVPGVPIISNLRSLSLRLAGGWHVSMGRPADWQTRVDATVAETDTKKSMDMFRGLVKTMVDECMNIPLWGQPDISAVNKKVKDLKWTLGGHPRFYEPQDAWISK